MAFVGCRLLLLCLLALVGTATCGTLHSRAPESKQAVAIATADRERRAGRRLEKAKCDESSPDQDDLQVGLKLGSQFLVNSQRSAGNFRYEYNWLSQKETEEDNPVRQAGTLWGLTLLHLDEPGRNLIPTIQKGLQYFTKHSVEFPGGVRMVNYPGKESHQKLGAVALLALSHIEVLRRPEALAATEKQQLEANLGGYLTAILAARTPKANFYKYYDGKTGKHFGPSSSYFDGECLLALIKAAKYLSHEHLWPHIKVSAEAGWRKNVIKGLKLFEVKHHRITHKKGMDAWDKKDASKRLQGYYQWGTMAWYELMGLEDPDFEKYARRTLRYSDWVAMRHPVKPSVNTGFNFEGLIPAFVTAVRQGDRKLEKKFACVINKGMVNLHSLQVGHPKAFGLAEPLAKAEDAKLAEESRAQGGAQGSRSSAALRIDTTQHHLHALLMARRLLQHQALI